MDEANGNPLIELPGLRPKIYYFLFDDNGHTTEKHRAKGIIRDASSEIRQQDNVDQLQRNLVNYLPNHRIARTLQQMYTIEIGRNSCSTFQNISLIDFLLILIFCSLSLYFRTRSVGCARSATTHLVRRRHSHPGVRAPHLSIQAGGRRVGRR